MPSPHSFQLVMVTLLGMMLIPGLLQQMEMILMMLLKIHVSGRWKRRCSIHDRACRRRGL